MLDVIIAVLIVLAIVRGWGRGLLGQVFALGGGFLGLILGVVLGPRVAGTFTDRPTVEGALISVLVVFTALSIGQTGGFIVGRHFHVMAHRARLGEVNSLLGAVFGAVVLLLSYWIVGSLLVQVPVRPLARATHRSVVLRQLNTILPRPPNLLAHLRQYLDTSGFPQVFAGIPRPVGPPVALPSNVAARRAVEAADQSVVRVVVPACGGTQFGSGWVVAGDMVVTNAHVVAGGDGVTIQDRAGSHSGRVVLFDSRTDVAVVRAEGLFGPPLALDTSGRDRGIGGATLGYPGGGNLNWRPAAVQGRFSAIGRDIYGRRPARREVYELRAGVRRGDSGGPFVLSSGEVAGVVFAASTTSASAGYALTGREIADEVRVGTGRTEPVSTGGCTR